jgi:serpin B
MQTRRDVLRTFTAAGAGSLMAAFGLAGDVAAGAGELVNSPVPRAPADPVARPDGVRMVQDFGADLYRRLATTPGNLICSPYSVLVALAMVRNGAQGQTADEIDHVLHAPALAQMNSGLNALQRLVTSRAGYRGQGDDGAMVRVILDVANSLWGQRGEDWRPGFLDALARDYGAGMHVVDYEKDPERARTEINRWTSGRTHGRIPRLFPERSIDQSTRLVLANAVYFKAPWATPFEKESTQPGQFTRADGTQLTVPMMNALVKTAGYAKGPGWQALRLPYKGEQLAMAIVLPDKGQLTEVERALDGAATGRLLGRFAPFAAEVTMPKWTFRTGLELTDTLAGLGMPTAFTDAADFGAMTARERLEISKVIHQAFVAVDEEGAEAAAATGVVVHLSSAELVSNTFVVDRPFLFFIYDVETATPLFVGRVTDPSAG